MTPEQLGRKIADMERRLARVENSPRLSHAAIDDTAVEVRDGAGALRALLGVQGDGTTAVNIVNGPPPPTPSAPVLGSVLGGVTVSWDGQFADGVVPPLDWQRVEVHASTETGFTASLETLKTTFETPQGGTVVAPCEEPVYVVLVARNTSGAASEPTVQAGPLGPAPVVATDILDGIVTEVKLAADAVTAAKIAAAAVGTTEIADDAVTTQKVIAGAILAGQIASGAVLTEKLAAGAVTTGKLDALAVTADKIAANAITAGKILAGAVDATALAADAITGKTITGGTITGSLIQTEVSGERITLNEAGQNKVLVYNSTEAIGELSSRGLLVKGTSGAVMWMRPDFIYPQLTLSNAADTNRAGVALVEPVTGDANLQMIGGKFSGSGHDEMNWGVSLSRDYAAIKRYTVGEDPERAIGGKLYLSPTRGYVGIVNDDDPTQDARVEVEANLATVYGGRLAVGAPASTFSALYVEADTAHTGALLRVFRDADKFTVDKDGNTSVAGRIKPMTGEAGNLTLQSGWAAFDPTNYGTPQVRKTADGRAYLIGRLTPGSLSSGTLVATLPNSSYWPVVRHAFPHRAAQGGVDVTLLVTETGELRIYDMVGTVANLSLAGLFWPLW